MRRPEQSLHRAVADLLHAILMPPTWWTTVPAGSDASKVRTQILNGLGYRAGTPDVLLVADGQAYFIELKSQTGRLSPAQRDTSDLLIAAGARFAICRSLDDVELYLRTWEIPTRTHRSVA